MDFFIENIIYIALLLTVFTFLFLFIKNKNHLNRSYNTTKISQYELDLKLRAYERLILFLDRIEPTGMINRLELHQMDVQTTASQLIKNIIIEYEYNVSQQIYVSDSLWDLIELLKNKTINHISDTVQSLNKTAPTRLLMKALNNSSQNKLLITTIMGEINVKNSQKTGNAFNSVVYFDSNYKTAVFRKDCYGQLNKNMVKKLAGLIY